MRYERYERYISARLNITDSEVWPADSPGEDGLAGDHQVVDGESNEDTVVAHHRGGPDDLIIINASFYLYFYYYTMLSFSAPFSLESEHVYRKNRRSWG